LFSRIQQGKSIFFDGIDFLGARGRVPFRQRALAIMDGLRTAAFAACFL
jgi:hypothetical protein